MGWTAGVGSIGRFPTPQKGFRGARPDLRGNHYRPDGGPSPSCTVSAKGSRDRTGESGRRPHLSGQPRPRPPHLFPSEAPDRGDGRWTPGAGPGRPASQPPGPALRPPWPWSPGPCSPQARQPPRRVIHSGPPNQSQNSRSQERKSRANSDHIGLRIRPPMTRRGQGLRATREQNRATARCTAWWTELQTPSERQ